VFLLPQAKTDSWLKQQLANATDDILLAGVISTQCSYGEFYLRDLVNASLYEPNAAGWAKGLAEDHFAYNNPALLAGALWQLTVFIEHYLSVTALQPLQQANLYVADSEQFGIAGQVLPQAVGA
jgi:hypothetical protein